jgi:hypothetical protein
VGFTYRSALQSDLKFMFRVAAKLCFYLIRNGGYELFDIDLGVAMSFDCKYFYTQ